MTVAKPAGTAGTSGRRTGRLRRLVGVVLVVLTALLSLVAVLSGYVRAELLTTDRYVEIVGPLAKDPDVQAEVVDVVTAKVVEKVELEGLSEDLVELLRARDGRLGELLNRDSRAADALTALLSGLGPMVQNQVEQSTRRAAQQVVRSPRFATLWTEANRIAHQKTLSALRDEGSALRTGDGAVRIDLGVVVEEVKQRLIHSGFALASRIPVVDSEIVVINSAQLAQVQQALLLFDQLAPWVPFLVFGSAIAAVLVWPRRRHGARWVAAGVAVAMIVLAIALAVTQSWVLGRVGDTDVNPAAVEAIVGAVLGPLWTRIWVVLGVAVAITLITVLSGPVGSLLKKRAATLG